MSGVNYDDLIYSEFPNNPRKFDSAGRERLKGSMDKYGDLSGIIYNRNTGNWPGGNQRLKILDFSLCKRVILEEYDEPDEFGTVAIGYIEAPDGARFNWRIVDWPEDEEKEANVFANKLGAEWDMEKLERAFDKSKLLDWGFRNVNNTLKGSVDEGETMEFERSVQLTPQMEYLVIAFDPGSEGFEEMKERLKLKRVRRGGYKEGSPFESVGLERVLMYEDFKDRYDSSSSK